MGNRNEATRSARRSPSHTAQLLPSDHSYQERPVRARATLTTNVPALDAAERTRTFAEFHWICFEPSGDEFWDAVDDTLVDELVDAVDDVEPRALSRRSSRASRVDPEPR